jgi:hypothetical protein
VAGNIEARRFVEIRSYRLKPGTAAEFDLLVTGTSAPMLRRWGIDVVAFGPSLLDGDSYYLIRAYASAKDLERSEAAFYGSDEWRLGPRGAVLACIEHYTSIVIEMDEVTIDRLRRSSQRAGSKDRPGPASDPSESGNDRLGGA